MIGVTITTPDMLEMASEAVSRFHMFTGLEVRVFVLPQTKDVNQTSDAFYHTLRLPELLGKPNTTVVFFDADWWMLRPVDLGQFNGKFAVHGVVDPTIQVNAQDHFPVMDCIKHKLDPNIYLNTGFLIFNKRHYSAFRKARRWMEKGRLRDTDDFSEQTLLNMALQRGGHPIQTMDCSYNFCPYASSLVNPGDPISNSVITNNPVAIHAAGVTSDRKLQCLRDWVSFYRMNQGGYHPERPKRFLKTNA